jgi:hypothetical protein
MPYITDFMYSTLYKIWGENRLAIENNIWVAIKVDPDTVQSET